MSASHGTTRRHVPQPKAAYIYYSIRKDGTKVFEVRRPRNANGQRLYEVVGTSLAEAKARANEIYHVSAPRVVSVGTTISDVIADWKETRVMRPRSVESFDGILARHVEPALGRTKVRDITPLVIERFLNGLKRADGKPGPLADGTRRLILATLDMVLVHAVKMGAIGSVPKVDRKRKPKAGESRRRIVSPVEEEALLFSCGRIPWLRPIITVALHQSLRLGEVAGLQWDDVDFAANKIRVAHSLGRDGSLGPTKGDKVCVIDLTPRAREALLKLRGDSDGQGFVFKNKIGGQRQLRDIGRAFEKARARAGLAVTDDGPVCFHSLRHTGISRLANHPRIPLVHVRDFARHADLATTQGYVHRIEDEKITTAIGEALAGSAS